MSLIVRITEDSKTRISEDGKIRVTEDSTPEAGVHDMTFATSFPTAHVSVGTIKIESGGFNR